MVLRMHTKELMIEIDEAEEIKGHYRATLAEIRRFRRRTKRLPTKKQ